jgi:hypothetical protein
MSRKHIFPKVKEADVIAFLTIGEETTCQIT